MRRLPAIGTAWFNPVVGPDGNIQDLFRVPIVVAQQQSDGPVGVLEPSLVCGGDALTGFPAWLERELRGAPADAEYDPTGERDSGRDTHRVWSHGATAPRWMSQAAWPCASRPPPCNRRR